MKKSAKGIGLAIIGAGRKLEPRDRVVRAALAVSLHIVDIGPDLGLERAAIGVEHADHFPIAAPKMKRRADAAILIAPAQTFADHHFAHARIEHAALDDVQLVMHVARHRQHTANDDIVAPALYVIAGADGSSFAVDALSTSGSSTPAGNETVAATGGSSVSPS